MSRSSHQRQQQKLQQQQQLLAQQQQMAENDAAAAAAEMFDLFCVATTMRQVLGLHRNMCDLVGLRPAPLNEFYPKLKAKIRSWKAQALWKKFDARAAHRAYAKATAATGTRVLVIGAGPCGMRTAIEAQLLGAKVVVVEKRDRISRNNVLHLWPFVITDLRNLGAKKFYGKFCAGSIDHISIRQLQCILLKVALLLGVEVHEGVSFDGIIEPNGDGCGWRAAVSPADHVVSHYEFDVLIGADGKRNTLEGFKRKEFRGKLAIAITANFINKKTEAEAKAEEISGVAFIFNQSFFKELYHTTGIDLENIVYYKDETHYFVMTAKKHSLIDKGVIMQDFADPAELLAPANVNTEKLLDYAREAAEFSTKYQMPNLEFAVNHYGKPDVAMFDFTSMFAAETSCRVIVRKRFRLLQCLVGDSLLEPFWPTGSGCARGFLSSMDAAYAIKLWSNPQNSSLGVLAQRESIYRLLNQTTPENLQRDIGSYTVDPATRYPNLNRTSVNVWQVKHLIDTDDDAILEQTFMDTNALQGTQVDTPVRRKRRSGDSTPLSTVLLRWICSQLHSYEFTKSLQEVSDVFTHGKVLCALINRYRPDLVDINAIKDLSPVECNDIAFKVLEKELNIPRVMSGREAQHLSGVESRVWLNYLEEICEVFRGEIPHVKHPKMDFPELREKYSFNKHVQPDFSKLLQKSTKPRAKISIQDMVDTTPQTAVLQHRSLVDGEDKLKRQRKHLAEGTTTTAAGTATGSGGGLQPGQGETPRRAKKRRSAEKAANIEERQKRLQEIELNRQDRQSKRRQQRYQQTQNFYKSLHMLHANTLLRESDESAAFEDYSIFLYRQQAPEFNDRVKELERKLLFPDRDRNDIPSSLPRNATDEQFSDRIRSMEQRISSKNTYGTEKKPRDLMRAIGKIDSNDWNVREIEKKIEQSKKTEIHGPKGREKVPKWSKEQFMARQHKMSKPMRQDSGEEKFKEIDQTLKNLDKQLKEGSVLEVGERGRNKVASIAGQFVKKDDTSDEKNPPTVVQKPSSKVALAFKKQAAFEKCHFCKQTVYLMEKINTEGLILHRSCLKCHHCHTNLRPGGYAFDRDDPNGRFYCTQHFRLPAKAIRPVVRKPGQRKPTQQQQSISAASVPNIVNLDDADVIGEPKTPDKLRVHADSVAHLDLLDRGQTPERIEFENTDAMSDGEPSEEHIIDENEWSGRNFLPESNKDSESDVSSSEESDSDMFEEANDSPLAVQTLQLATDWIGKQNYSDSDDFDDFYDSSDGVVDDDKDDTEGEEFKKARELRREEVRLLPLPANLPTDTETEVQSDSESTASDKVEQNSATEISTDSEFDHDEIIRETPKIFIDDTHLRKPTKVHVKSIITPSSGQKYHTATSVFVTPTKGGSYLQKYQPHNNQPLQPQFKPLVQVDPSVLYSNRMPLENPRPGDYFLNKTASTEGIACKKSLELKKRYLLGEQANGNKIQKSGSTSVLDSKIRSFHSNISECQKLLNPGNDKVSNTKTFLDHTKLGKTSSSDTTNITRSATGNILNDLKVDITIQKASSTASTDNEKENLFVNSKNELNKGMEYSESVNSTLVESLGKKSPTTPTNNQKIIEIIDLVTPEKKTPIIDLTQVEIPIKMLESNVEFMKNIEVSGVKNGTTDSNKIIDLTCPSPVKSDKTVIESVKPDISKDVKECIPDIIEHIEGCDGVISANKNQNLSSPSSDEQHRLLTYSYDEEKKDSPEKPVAQDYENHDLQIEVPNIPWNTRKPENSSSNSLSTCSSNTSSIEDIQHFILESTTSPDTQTGSGLGVHQVPRLEVHDTSGELMQIDSLMIIDGRYIGDPEDLKLLEIPEGLIIPELPAIQTPEVEDEPDIEPVTATPEPADRTIIEAEDHETMAFSEPRPPIVQPVDLKFDSRNENKVETLKNLPLNVEEAAASSCKAVKPLTLNLKNAQKSTENQTTPTMNAATPTSPLIDNDKTPTVDLVSRGSDSETEATGTGQVLTETELSDWTADDCISENFIDIEFVLNSNKGTIKRNKKGGKKKVLSAYKELSMRKETLKNPVDCRKIAPVAEFEGILRNLDIEEIEFMDTGSEGSCADAHSATNTAMLRNRGYMEFFETTPKNIPCHKITDNVQKLKDPPDTTDQYKSIPTKRDEVLGIDYIEQGAYIMQTGNSQQDLLKTPVNDQPLLSTGVDRTERSSLSQPPIALSQSLTDSSTLNDVDDDSLGMVTNSGANTKTTTDESEALTVVTSPLDSSSPKIAELFVAKGMPSTPSSSDKNPKTSTLSTYSPTSASTASSSSATSPRLSATQEKIATAVGTKVEPVSIHQPTSDEICYKDYVRALQQKITQISNARDSLDTRKQRRKSCKGEAPLATFSSDTQTVIEQQIRTASGESSSQSLTPPRLEAVTTSIGGVEGVPESPTSLAQLHKVPEIPTLTSRLEEITKERTKQKDLIHDLVMDKLQSKKQLNAEKRLHRSRQRNMMTAGGCGYTSGSSLSPTPKLAAASTTTDTNCTSQAHYHVSTSAPAAPKERPTVKEYSLSSSFKENKPLQKSSAYVAAYCMDSAITPPRSSAYIQRPFSEHLDAEQLDAHECYKLSKTPSFTYAMSASRRNLNIQQSNKEDKKQISNSPQFETPIAPLRGNRERTVSGGSLASPTLIVNEEHPISVTRSIISTDKLRNEARARARLKSNNELGLSPEEKILLLRKRLNLENNAAIDRQNYAKSVERDIPHGRLGYDLKMSSSKSVNDLVTATHIGGKMHGYTADENSNTTQSAVMADFTSDPNLLLTSTTAQAGIVKPLKGDAKITRRQKDPERRKSIIQSLSNFFHMGNSSSGSNGGKKDSSSNGTTGSAANSAQPERPGTSSSCTTSSSVDGVFSRFRLAPKLREKSKSCFDMRSSGFGDKDAGVTSRDNTISPTTSTTTIPSPAKNNHYERSSSQDCILNPQTNNDSCHNYNNTTKQHSNHSYNHNQHHHHHHHHHRHHNNNTNNNNSGNKQHLDSSARAKHFASSPQLFVNPFTVVTPDEQTPPPIPPLPLHYQRSDDESYATETREQKKQRSISKAVRQAELKRLRIAQEIQREQEEIEVQLKELEARGVLIEKALRGEGQHLDSLESSGLIGANDEKLLKQLLEIWRNITQLKKRDEELSIRQQELQLEHRHAQLKEELNMRLSSSKLDKGSADVAAEGAILNEMLEIVAKRASLRPSTTTAATSPSAADMEVNSKQHEASTVTTSTSAALNTDMQATNSAAATRSRSLKLSAIVGAQSLEINESHI